MPKITLLDALRSTADAISCSAHTDSARTTHLDNLQAYIDQETPDIIDGLPETATEQPADTE